MSRRGLSIGLALIAASAFGGLGLTSEAGQAHLLWQATPASSGITDVTVEILGRGPSSIAPGFGLQLIQLTFAPGGSIAMHDHPGDAVFYVASGTIGWTTGSGTPLLSHPVSSAPAQGATPVPPEPLAAGLEVLLQPGDAVFYDQAVTHEVRNAGSTDAVVLYSALRASDQPGIEFTAATPVA